MLGLGRNLIILTFLVGSAVSFIAAKPNDVKIVVGHSPEGRHRVSISFPGNADGTTQLKLPNEWGGQRELYKAIAGLRSPNSRISPHAQPHLRTLTHRPGQRVDISYELVQDFPGGLRNEVRYRPVADQKHLHWIGNAIWILPAWEDLTDLSVEIEWRNFPENWIIANSFGVGERKQRFTTQLGNLYGSVFVAGDFRLTRTEVEGKPVNVAIRGFWQFKDDDFADMVRRVIAVQRSFWKENSQEYFLVTLVPIDQGPNAFSFGGTGLTDSFALFATPNATVDRLRELLAHEYSHNWIPMRLGRLPQPEQQLYWFTEGFTEFYMLRTLLRAGLITKEEFVAGNNERIREYYLLPTRTASNERIVNDFWRDTSVQRLPYLRGFLFATNLNAAIVAATGGKASLDDAMFDLVFETGTRPPEITFDRLAKTFSKHLGSDAAPSMRKYLLAGELIVPAPTGLGEGFSLETAEVPIFELGFDIDKFGKDKVVSGLDPGSAAYAAGLRNGQQRLGGVSFTYGDTSREIELKIKDAEGEKTIRFFPIAKQRVRIPKYRIG